MAYTLLISFNSLHMTNYASGIQLSSFFIATVRALLFISLTVEPKERKKFIQLDLFSVQKEIRQERTQISIYSLCVRCKTLWLPSTLYLKASREGDINRYPCGFFPLCSSINRSIKFSKVSKTSSQLGGRLIRDSPNKIPKITSIFYMPLVTTN